MQKPESVLINKTYKILWDFLDINGSPDPIQETRFSDN